jgi:predicted N-acetyltransferase YhbS
MDYQFSPIETDQKSLMEIAELLKKSFPDSTKFTLPFLEWQYRDNPDGKIVGFNAFQNGKLVAHYAVQPMYASIDGKNEKGLLSLNTATHPEHQGKKLFTRLAEMSYESAAKQGYRFVVGVANANSTHGFINKLGFQLVGKLHAKLGFGKIVRTRDAHHGYKRNWNKENTEWRLSNPENKYSVNESYVLASAQIGINAILSELNEPLSFKGFKKSSGLKPLKLWIGIDSTIDWKKSKYFDIPDKLRPSPLNFIFKDLSGSSRKLLFSAVRFSAIDFDAY